MKISMFEGKAIIENKHLEKYSGYNTINEIILSSYLYGKLLVQDGDYKKVFNHFGVNKLSLDVCFEYTEEKINKLLKSLI